LKFRPPLLRSSRIDRIIAMSVIIFVIYKVYNRIQA
jgi:hypothetical protein